MAASLGLACGTDCYDAMSDRPGRHDRTTHGQRQVDAAVPGQPVVLGPVEGAQDVDGAGRGDVSVSDPGHPRGPGQQEHKNNDKPPHTRDANGDGEGGGVDKRRTCG